jgi:hypothetical protein
VNGYQITFFTHQDRRHKGKVNGFLVLSMNCVFAALAYIRAGRVLAVAVGCTRRISLSLPINPSRSLSR